MMLASYPSAPELTDAYVEQVWQSLPAFVRPTLFVPATRLSAELGCEITIASESLQYTGSFKFRAAYNLLASVPQKNIVAASSGNFGQAVAYACQLLGKTCTVVMPSTSAQVKIAAVQSYGGVADLIEVREISRAGRMAQLLEQSPDAFGAQAYDDYRVVAGNSTLGKEILAYSHFDTIVAPVGGGGLSSGIVVARDHLQATTEIVGAEPQPGNDASRSLQAGRLIKNEAEPHTIADGARTISLGQINWEILQHGLAEIIEVPDAQTLAALKHCFLYANLKVEPTGALTLGALLTNPERFKGKRVCCIVSGGNVDPTVYAHAITSNPTL
ncbi:threonine ammonia-lyase [Dictyobacter aurantiacus]|uniref:Serine/threonine dehydratase n=1 Tax=Dictyobacter aurantiacus TaxID=1936993 RepID=A0A401ZL18_9CHLR|nr:pyridoxal-phosphate dependent enzyme [Dictyobacter aurantiacus]GCE07522.1 serine/threonine dehydratase [Dictyobacter aurantiacus]